MTTRAAEFSDGNWGPADWGDDEVFTGWAHGGFASVPTITSGVVGSGGGPGSTTISGASIGSVSIGAGSAVTPPAWLIGTSAPRTLVRDARGNTVGWRFNVDGEGVFMVPLVELDADGKPPATWSRP